MFGIENFYLFLSVSILINLSPGPDMLYTAARSLSQGTRAGLVSALGIFAGCLFHITAAVFGLSAIIAQSAFWFSVIKYAGALYLIYLGVKSLLNIKPTQTEIAALDVIPLKKIFLQGLITNLLNPKVAIFFLSFLPQFVNPSSVHIKEQIIFLGLWFDVQGVLILMLVALLTGYFSRLLKQNKKFWKWQDKITGLILVALGIRMFFVRK
ncbi:MAG: LysE family translocator [Chitinophagaceae bacterium]|nr:MAG: LysE family translocator [Chitinophagaceae bacterium]